MEKICKFLNRVFEGNRWTERKLIWKYKKNPAGIALILTKEDKENIIGFRALVPWQFIINKREQIIYQFCEASTHPEYRGKHIFSELTKEAMKKSGKHIFFNYPHEGNSLPAYKRSFGTMKVDEIKYMIIMNRIYHFPKLFRKDEENEYFVFDRSARKINKITKHKWEQLLAKLPEKSLENGKIIPKRGLNFIKWRFIENPLKHYRLVLVIDSKKPVGYLIFNKRKYFKVNILTVIDILKTKEFNQSRDIIQIIKTILRKWKEPLIIYPCLKSMINNDRELKKIFIIPKKHINLAVTDYNSSNIGFYLNPNNWIIYPADVDTF